MTHPQATVLPVHRADSALVADEQDKGPYTLVAGNRIGKNWIFLPGGGGVMQLKVRNGPSGHLLVESFVWLGCSFSFLGGKMPSA